MPQHTEALDRLARRDLRRKSSGNMKRTRPLRVTRAQAQYKGKLPDQREAAAQFQSKPERFRLLAWGKGKRSGDAPLQLGRMGRVKRYASADVSLCDIDTVRAPRLEKVFRLAHVLGVGVRWVRLDRSHSGRWHLLVCWRARFSKLELIAIQAILGSDYKREAFNLYRVRSGVRSRRWNFLFDEKLELA